MGDVHHFFDQIEKNMDNQKQTKNYSENPQEIINESFDIIDSLVDFRQYSGSLQADSKKGYSCNRRY